MMEDKHTAAYESQLDMVTEFVREGITHGTIAEAVYQALREVREGASISLALQLAKDEWYK